MAPSAPLPEPSPLDRELVARCAAREPRAQDELVERFARLVHAVVLRTLQRHGERPDDDRLSDLFAAAFLALVDDGARRLRQWDGGCSLATWVRLVTATTTLDRLRGERRAARRVADDVELELLPADGASALELAAKAERLARLERALERLADGDRELLRILYVEEVAPGEAAARLGVAAGALYTRKNRALERLRSAWAEVGGDDV